MKTIIEFIKDDPVDAIEGIIAWAGLIAVAFMMFVIGG